MKFTILLAMAAATCAAVAAPVPEPCWGGAGCTNGGGNFIAHDNSAKRSPVPEPEPCWGGAGCTNGGGNFIAHDNTQKREPVPEPEPCWGGSGCSNPPGWKATGGN